MNIQIEDNDLKELILTGTNNKYIQLARDQRFMTALGRAYRLLEVVENTNGLRRYSYLHYEQLKGVRKSSIRIMNGRVERLIFEETNNYNTNYSAYVWVYDQWGYYTTLSPGSNPGYTSFEQMARNGEPVGYYDGNGGFYLYVTYYYMTGIGGWSQNAYDLMGVTEGYTRVDYSIEAETDYSHNGEVPVYLTVGPDVAKVIYCAYPGELTPTQIENKAAAIETDDNSAVIEEFEGGEGEKYADFTLDLGTTGFYTFVGVTYDANGVAQEVGSVVLNYVSADDEETYKVIVDCGTEEVPSRYTGYDPTTSFAYYVTGQDLTEAHVAVYKMSDYTSKTQAVLDDIKYKHAVDAETLAKINANGGWFTVADGLNPATEYVVLVWATNGLEEAFTGDTWKTDELPYVWNNLGKGLYTDDVACPLYGIDPITVSCDVYEEQAHPGLYKFSGFQLPLVATAFGASEEELLDYEGIYWRNSEIVVDATNPADVRIALQDYGVCFDTEDGFIDGITSLYKGEPFSVGTLEDGVISFPTAKGMLCTINGDGYYYANINGAFKLVLPNVNAAGTESVAVPSTFKKGTKAGKSLYQPKQTDFERDANTVPFTSKKIEHKYQKPAQAQKLIKE